MNIEMENGMQMTLDEFVPMTSQKQTVGASDSLAKISQLPESSLDFKETVQACFSELCTLSDSSKKKINTLTYSLRTGGWDFARLLVEMVRGGVRCRMASAQLQRFWSATKQRKVLHYRTS